MADPISTVSGIAGIVSLAGVVLAKCYNYGCAVADAPSEVKKLLAEVNSLSGILVALQARGGAEDKTQPGRDSGCESSDDLLDALSSSLEECRQTLQEIRRALDAAKMDSDNRLSRAAKRFIWPLKQKDTMSLVGRLHRQKETFTLALVGNTA